MLLSPVLPEKSLAMLFAPRGIGKSWLGLSIGVAVASGGSLLKWEAPAPRRVLVADGEMPLADLIVAIEQTGTYHRPVQEACRHARFDTRLVHPYASQHYRQAADPDNKTDDRDLAAIFQAAISGFGLLDPVWPDDYQQLQLLVRHRRDLVRKNARLRCQIQEVLHSLMPGYAACFAELFEAASGLLLARRTGSAAAVQAAGITGLRTILQEAGVQPRMSLLSKILAWASSAPAPPAQVAQRRQILLDQHAVVGGRAAERGDPGGTSRSLGRDPDLCSAELRQPIRHGRGHGHRLHPG
jgi:transposase